MTIGQYLRPTKRHAPVARYVEPEEFAEYEQYGNALGFRFVASGPLVRSSYRAAEAFLHDTLVTGSESPRSVTPASPAPAMNRYGKKRKLSVVT